MIADIDDDPLPAVVSSLDLLAANDSVCLDGICYEIHTDTNSCQATIRFSNPKVSCFRHIETALITVAEGVAQASQESTVVEYVDMWRSYLTESGRTT